MKELCERIQTECRRKGRSLGYVMGKANLGSSIFYKWQKGQSTPRPQSIKAIAKALGMPAVELAPELSDALNEETEPDDADAKGDVVFIGMKSQVFNALKPFLERAGDNIIYVPEECAAGLLFLIRDIGELHSLLESVD